MPPWDVASTLTLPVRAQGGESTNLAMEVPRFASSSRLGRYKVLGVLGSGGMGTVYRARDIELQRDVALKRIEPSSGGGRHGLEESQARLRREAQAMARIDHPAVVRIYDAGIAEEQLFVAMELVDGGTLVDWLNAAPRTWHQIVNVMVSAGRGLAAAHRAGLVHRDIKPGNILVDERGNAKVTDFGLARRLDDHREEMTRTGELLSAVITQAGAVAGTPAYMAPEQLLGDAVDARADQFSFCTTLWEALCGARPFSADEEGSARLSALRSAILSGRLVEPLGGTGVPRRVLSLVRRGLAGEPAARWSSMNELLDSLERAARRNSFRRNLLSLGALALFAALLTSDRPIAVAGALFDTELGQTVPMGERFKAHPLTFTLLRDGRFLKVEEGVLAVGSNLWRWRPLRAPLGHRPIAARAAGSSDSALVYTMGDGCLWWLAPLDGGPWQRLDEDPGCARQLAFDVSPDGETLAVAGEHGLALRTRKHELKKKLYKHPIRQSIPVWSPDAARIAIAIDGKVTIFDVRDGSLRDLGESSKPQWLDADRLVYVFRVSLNRSELRMLNMKTGKQETLSRTSRIAEISVSSEGLLLMRQQSDVGVYEVKASEPRSRAVDELNPVRTGAEQDFGPAAWARDGALISFARNGDHRGLVRTMLGEVGGSLVEHRVQGLFAGGTSMGRVLYGVGQEGRFEMWTYDLATGQQHFWREVSDPWLRHMTCARRAPRCYLHDDSGRWFDPVAMAPAAPGPKLQMGEKLSPDGTKTILVRDASLTLRDLDSGVEQTILPQPPIVGRMEVSWGADSETLLVLTSSPEQETQVEGHHRLLLMTRDGRWRPLVEDDSYTLWDAVVSDDGSRIAFSAQYTETTWQYLPLPRSR